MFIKQMYIVNVVISKYFAPYFCICIETEVNESK
jgi:hypothetical protein